jgi:hypothetical protein
MSMVHRGIRSLGIRGSDVGQAAMKSYLFSAVGLLALAGLARGQQLKPEPMRATGPALTQWFRPVLGQTSFAEERVGGAAAPLPFSQIEAAPPIEDAPPRPSAEVAPAPGPGMKVESRPSQGSAQQRIPF